VFALIPPIRSANQDHLVLLVYCVGESLLTTWLMGNFIIYTHWCVL